MHTLTVEIDQAIATRFPAITIGGFAVGRLGGATKKIDSTGLLKQAIADLSARGLTPATLGDDPLIAGWRAAFQLQGLKPSKYRTSPDALARRALRGDSVQTQLPLVNAYNAISLRFLTPLGAYDLDRLPEQHMTLRFARPASDTFAPLGAEAANMPLLPTVAVYAMGDEILCWGFNHRDSRLACLQPQTEAAVFFSEGVVQEHRVGIVSALSALRQLLLEAGAVVSNVAVSDHSGVCTVRL
jgi:lysyl-tRNA synthetase class 2